MGKSPLAKSIIIGAALQLLMVGVGLLVPGLGARNNFYPIAGTTVAALVGARFSRRSAGVPMSRALSGGALAGAGSSLIGSIAAVIAGALPAAPAQTVLIATITGAMAGLVGGVLGRTRRR